MSAKQRERLEAMRRHLIDRGLYLNRVRIGAAVQARPAMIPRDQEWVQRLFLA